MQKRPFRQSVWFTGLGILSFWGGQMALAGGGDGGGKTDQLTKVVLKVSGQELGIVIVFAVALMLVHLFSARLLHFLRETFQRPGNHHLNPEVIASSLGGGIAVAYVFLHLIPELNHAHENLTEINAYIMLGGVLLFYGLESAAGQLAGQSRHEEWRFIERRKNLKKFLFPIHIIFLGLYNALIVYTIPEQFFIGSINISIYCFSMLLHLFSDNYFLEERYRKPFKQWGRYVLAFAPLFGALAVWFIPPNVLVADILTALLAGFILLNVFKDELQSDEKSSYFWFVAGVILFGFLLIMSHS